MATRAHGGAEKPEVIPLADCEGPIYRRFEALAVRDPERVALRAAAGTLTYGTLAAQAFRIAHAVVRERGAREEAVALLLDKDAPLIAAFLGVLAAGKIFVPLDPSYPRERQRFILEDSGAPLLITDARRAADARAIVGAGHRLLDLDSLDAFLPTAAPALPLSGDTLATILYTSGSTGRPKGVLQDHRSILHNAMNMANSLRLGADDRVGLVQSLSVVGGVRDTLAGLLSGSAVAVYDLPTLGVGPMAGWLRREGVTIVNMVVTVFRHFAATLDPADQFPTVRVLKSGSEALTARDVETFHRHFPPPAVLWSGFGTTETGNATQLLIDRATPLSGGGVPTGLPLDGMEVLILDEAGAPVPRGEIGELVVRSRYLALGYWRLPDLTSRAFREDAGAAGAQRYHTGDLARLAADGGLELIGRRDAMVKIRGLRVELGEVEAALLALPEIAQAAVLAHAQGPGDIRLAAYVVPRELPGPGPADLRRALAATLPASMVPARFITLPALPATPQGKVDRRALPTPNWGRVEGSGPLVLPRTPVERELAPIWAEVLGVERIGVTDAFLDLGGNSLLAGRLAACVQERLAVSIPMPVLLAASSVEAMAVVVTAALLDGTTPSKVTPPLPR
jgi:amino acid adenylation domain-containing protein